MRAKKGIVLVTILMFLAILMPLAILLITSSRIEQYFPLYSKEKALRKQLSESGLEICRSVVNKKSTISSIFPDYPDFKTFYDYATAPFLTTEGPDLSGTVFFPVYWDSDNDEAYDSVIGLGFSFMPYGKKWYARDPSVPSTLLPGGSDSPLWTGSSFSPSGSYFYPSAQTIVSFVRDWDLSDEQTGAGIYADSANPFLIRVGFRVTSSTESTSFYTPQAAYFGKVSDENSRYPIYDMFHNPDDLDFVYPVNDNTTPGQPGILQTESLAWVDGLGGDTLDAGTASAVLGRMLDYETSRAQFVTIPGAGPLGYGVDPSTMLPAFFPKQNFYDSRLPAGIPPNLPDQDRRSYLKELLDVDGSYAATPGGANGIGEGIFDVLKKVVTIDSTPQEHVLTEEGDYYDDDPLAMEDPYLREALNISSFNTDHKLDLYSPAGEWPEDYMEPSWTSPNVLNLFNERVDVYFARFGGLYWPIPFYIYPSNEFDFYIRPSLWDGWGFPRPMSDWREALVTFEQETSGNVDRSAYAIVNLFRYFSRPSLGFRNWIEHQLDTTPSASDGLSLAYIIDQLNMTDTNDTDDYHKDVTTFVYEIIAHKLLWEYADATELYGYLGGAASDPAPEPTNPYHIGYEGVGDLLTYTPQPHRIAYPVRVHVCTWYPACLFNSSLWVEYNDIFSLVFTSSPSSGLGFRPVFTIENPPGFANRATHPNKYLTDDSVWFALFSEAVYASSPYRTFLYRDDANVYPDELFPHFNYDGHRYVALEANGECDDYAFPEVAGTCVWPRPKIYRGKININTASRSVLAALFRKFTDDYSVAWEDAGYITDYRRYYYYAQNTRVDGAFTTLDSSDDNGTLHQWTNVAGDFAPSYYLQYLLEQVFGTDDNTDDWLITHGDGNPGHTRDLKARALKEFDPILSPPFRSIGELFMVAANPGGDARDVTTARDFNVTMFRAIDQDLCVRSFAYRLESFGYTGEMEGDYFSTFAIYKPLARYFIEYDSGDFDSLTLASTQY